MIDVIYHLGGGGVIPPGALSGASRDFALMLRYLYQTPPVVSLVGMSG